MWGTAVGEKANPLVQRGWAWCRSGLVTITLVIYSSRDNYRLRPAGWQIYVFSPLYDPIVVGLPSPGVTSTSLLLKCSDVADIHAYTHIGTHVTCIHTYTDTHT